MRHYFLLVFLFCSAFFAFYMLPDGAHRLDSYEQMLNKDFEYPQFAPWLTRFTIPVLGEVAGTLILLITLVIAIPAILIERGYGAMAGVAWLFGAGGMVVLMDTTAIAQAGIQILMLLSLANPVFYAVFAFMGPAIHREWLGALVLTFLFDWARLKDGRIIQLV